VTISPIGSPGSGVEIDGPKCGSIRFGLLDIAEVEDGPDHFELGFHHRELACSGITSTVVSCIPEFGDHPAKDTDGSGLTWPFSNTFALIAPWECSTFGIPIDESYRLAEARLDRGEDREVERVFWTGIDSAGNAVTETIGNASPVELNPAGAVDLTTAIGLLEEWAGAENPCLPTLHMPRVLAAALDERNLATTYSDGVRRRSTLNPVVLGSGYTRDLPGFPVGPGEAYIAITGGVKILKGVTFFAATEDDPASIVNREVNDQVVFAEKTFGFALSGCAVAVAKVTIS